MSLTEIQEAVGEMPQAERHELLVWLERKEEEYGDIPDEAFAQFADELFVALDQEEEAQVGGS